MISLPTGPRIAATILLIGIEISIFSLTQKNKSKQTHIKQKQTTHEKSEELKRKEKKRKGLNKSCLFSE
jgi:hypothetical protein